MEVVADKVEDDSRSPADKRTAELMKEVANSICENTTMEVDYPSNNADGWLPVLDNKMRIEDGKVDWKFYRKPVDSKFFILSRSALSGRIKRSSLAQEGIRRLKNTRPDKVEQRMGELLTDMAESMMLSGYPEGYRQEILEAAVVGYRRQVAASERGERPLYRGREWNKKERTNEKRMKKAAWFRPSDV